MNVALFCKTSWKVVQLLARVMSLQMVSNNLKISLAINRGCNVLWGTLELS